MTHSNDVRHLLVETDASGNRAARPIRASAMESLGWRERDDLQQLLRDHPDAIEPGLLLITEEFAGWESQRSSVRDRLDLLFLDQAGRPMVVELKRGQAPDRTESQALQYAAYCDQLRTQDLIELLHQDRARRDPSFSEENAQDAITTHAEILAKEQPGRVRVRLIAEEFPPAVTATVLFLRELGSSGPDTDRLDIGCSKIALYEVGEDQHVLAVQPIVPLPETEEYLVKRRRRESQEEAEREVRARIPNAVPLLQARNSLAAGTRLRLNRAWYSPGTWGKIAELLQAEPEWEFVTWTAAQVSTQAVQFGDDEPSSLNAHYLRVRKAAGLSDAPDATSAFLIDELGKTIRDYADEILAGERDG